ncbi:hypothetical protein G9A89_012722 [Geosiphon pyriformis]|nr:hypothetical protein G9A89_012722 [Geosiphon pyriformis]
MYQCHQPCQDIEHQVTDLLFDLRPQIIIKNQYQQLINTESAFNFYVNERIAYLLRTPVNTKLVRETFYHELIQNTSLLTNHNFTSIITEINKEIEHHAQQRYPITYLSKGKEKLQTPAVTPQQIQPLTWKKHRVELSTNPSYHYTPKNTIHITSPNASTSNVTLLFGQFLFQTDLLEALESEEERKSEDQEFTYQNSIPENLEVETLNNILNPNSINQPNLPPNIVIDYPPINPIAQPLLQQPNQQIQQLQQQLQPSVQQQQPNVDPIAYAPIAKLDNFTGEEDNAQVWLNDVEKAITANGWNNARALQAIPYFLKNTANS